MNSVKIGKFDIFATYSYCKGKQEGMSEDQAKIYGYMIAVCGANARRGKRGGFKPKNNSAIINELKKKAEKKKKKSISTKDFERIQFKIGKHWDSFVKRMNDLFEKGLSYEQVKTLANIPSKWGAKISIEDFMKNTE